ncbi:MAG: hypothetical protein RIA63_06230, partial [Cyclobacteriaceae bacterium]
MAKGVSVLLMSLLSLSRLLGGPGQGFIENKNQWPCDVDFLVDVPGGKMAIQAGIFNYFFLDYQKINDLHERGHSNFKEVSTATEDIQIEGRKVTVRFVGANFTTRPRAVGRHSAYHNYFFGSDPEQWGSRAHAYSEIDYPGIYEGIDLKLYEVGQNIKYDLIVAAGADPNKIQIEYCGAVSMSISHGDLVVDAKLAEILEKKPVAFQWIDGNKRYVKAEYYLVGDQLSFVFPDGYDPCYELVIDPLLIFSTYSGSTADNWGSTATPGEGGNVYSSGVTNHLFGTTFSGVFPATPGAFQTSYGGLYDVAILKYDSAGQNLLYASYLGGADSESPHSLVMNGNQELLVLGTTSSGNFPTTINAFDRTYNDPSGVQISHVVTYNNGSDIFVSKISKDGSQLLASTFLGGTSADGLNPTTGLLAMNYGDQLRGDIITDLSNDIYISTVTSSTDFPVSSAFDITYNGGSTDALVLKLKGDLSQILWGGYMGGAGEDAAYTIKLDSEEKLWLAGGTTSLDFPSTPETYQTVNKGNTDGWIANIENDGSAIIAATFTGTISYNQIYFLDLNDNDEVYVYGQTAGVFPITAETYSNP